MKRFSLFYFLLFFGLKPSFGELSLDSAIKKATAHSPALKQAQFKILGAKSTLREIGNSRFPRASIRSSYSRGDNPVYVFGSLLEQKEFGVQNFSIDSLNNPPDLTNVKNAFDVGLPIFSGFEISSGEEIQKLRIEQEQKESLALEQLLQVQVLESFLRSLQAQEILKIFEERVRSAEQEINKAKKLNARGLILGSDFFAAQAILGGLKARQLEVDTNYKVNRESLLIMMGDPTTSTVSIRGKLEHPSYDVDEGENLVEKALMVRNDIKLANLQVQLAEVMSTQSRRSFYPKVEAFASLETNTKDFQSNPTHQMVGVKSQFPIGDPSYGAKKSQAHFEAQAAKKNKEYSEELIRIEIMKALRAYQVAKESLLYVKNAMEDAQKSLQLVKPLYQEGRQSILDVLKAEEGLARAQEAYITTNFHIHHNYARLLFSTGEWSNTVVKDVEKRIESGL